MLLLHYLPDIAISLNDRRFDAKNAECLRANYADTLGVSLHLKSRGIVSERERAYFG